MSTNVSGKHFPVAETIPATARFGCCECCEDRAHKIGHSDPCSRHQRALPKRRRS